jgi:hypothetical protein
MADSRLSTEKITPGGLSIKNRRVEAIWEGFVCAWGLRQPERETVTLTACEKHAIADEIVTESRSKSDVVEDVFGELIKHFELRRTT